MPRHRQLETRVLKGKKSFEFGSTIPLLGWWVLIWRWFSAGLASVLVWCLGGGSSGFVYCCFDDLFRDGIWFLMGQLSQCLWAVPLGTSWPWWLSSRCNPMAIQWSQSSVYCRLDHTHGNKGLAVLPATTFGSAIRARLRHDSKGVAARFFQLMSGQAMTAPFLKERWGWTISDVC